VREVRIDFFGSQSFEAETCDSETSSRLSLRFTYPLTTAKRVTSRAEIIFILVSNVSVLVIKSLKTDNDDFVGLPLVWSSR
jgi:hypothetical protein